MRPYYLVFLLLLSACSSPASPKPSPSPTQAVVSNPAPANTQVNTAPQPAPVAAPQPPLISISGFKKGDEYTVDGPLWYDGTAKLEEFSATEMRINIIMSAPSVGLPYQLKDGKVNVTIRLFKDSKLNLYLSDINKGKTYMVPGVSLETGKTDAGWFSTSKEYAKIVASTQYYNFTVESPTVITISSNAMPGGLTLTKK